MGILTRLEKPGQPQGWPGWPTALSTYKDLNKCWFCVLLTNEVMHVSDRRRKQSACAKFSYGPLVGWMIAINSVLENFLDDL